MHNYSEGGRHDAFDVKGVANNLNVCKWTSNNMT